MSASNSPPLPFQTGKNLILCFDGTGNSFDDTNTNVVKLYSILEKTANQMTYYQPGLGTYLGTGLWAQTAQSIAAKMDEAFAMYIEHHVCGGYKFLQENYRPGDRIYLFGFSRGAYTARAVAGMLHKVGLLAKDNIEQISFAYQLYEKPFNFHEANAFKRTFSHTVRVEFLGCWDTVCSVGYIYGKVLPYTLSNKIVRTFRHALALDEHRGKFEPSYWQDAEVTKTVIIDEYSYGNIFSNAFHWISSKLPFGNKIVNPKVETGLNIAQDADDSLLETNVLEVWFAGCHCDVGGGSLTDDEVHSLAHPSLRWMVNELLFYCSEIHLNLDEFALVTLGLQAPSGPAVNHFRFIPENQAQESETYQEMEALFAEVPPHLTCLIQMAALNTLEKEQPLLKFDVNKAIERYTNPFLNFRRHCEIADLITSIHDQLKKWRWKILEWVPLDKYHVLKVTEDHEEQWYLRRFWQIHLARGRKIPGRKNHRFHYTVKRRLESKTLRYKPLATFEDKNHPEPIYVYDASFMPSQLENRVEMQRLANLQKEQRHLCNCLRQYDLQYETN